MIFASFNCSVAPPPSASSPRSRITSSGLEDMGAATAVYPGHHHQRSRTSTSSLSDTTQALSISDFSFSPTTTMTTAAAIAAPLDGGKTTAAKASGRARLSFTIDSILGRGDVEDEEVMEEDEPTTPCTAASPYKSMATSLPDLVGPESSIKSYMERLGGAAAAAAGVTSHLSPSSPHAAFMGATWPYQFLPYITRPLLTAGFQGKQAWSGAILTNDVMMFLPVRSRVRGS